MAREGLLLFHADQEAPTTKLKHGRWIGKPKPPDLAHAAPVRIRDAAGVEIAIVIAEEWRRLHPISDEPREELRPEWLIPPPAKRPFRD